MVINTIDEDKQKTISNWIVACKKGKERPESCKNNRDLNSYFIELFLDKHKYYDRKRKYLRL
ncbi:hypothetical protein J4232_03165 [Candidatus Woesearchaeota archaeon]|nr:hypothetical protein [Candidatus Woesearchaeota archaeon]